MTAIVDKKATKQRQIGNQGEAQALAWYQQQGFQLVTAQYRYRRAEIDLVMRKDHLLVFVEVKSRSSTAFGHPESFVSPEQEERILEAAAAFQEAQHWQGQVRFDVVAITAGQLEHFPDALG